MSVGKYVRGVTSQLRLGECEACSSPPGLLSRALTLTLNPQPSTLTLTLSSFRVLFFCVVPQLPLSHTIHQNVFLRWPAP